MTFSNHFAGRRPLATPGGPAACRDAVILRIPDSGARPDAGGMEQSYAELPNSIVGAANGISYAYRDTGGHDGAVPLVLLQHFRGNLDSWDPA